MRYAKIDKNQPELVSYLRSLGCVVKHVHTVKKLFDILVYFKGKTYSVEIKTDRKKELTKGEKECKTDLESVGVKYWVITNKEDCLKMLDLNLHSK